MSLRNPSATISMNLRNSGCAAPPVMARSETSSIPKYAFKPRDQQSEWIPRVARKSSQKRSAAQSAPSAASARSCIGEKCPDPLPCFSDGRHFSRNQAFSQTLSAVSACFACNRTSVFSRALSAVSAASACERTALRSAKQQGAIATQSNGVERSPSGD